MERLFSSTDLFVLKLFWININIIKTILDDEPYSPGGSDDDLMVEPSSLPPIKSSSTIPLPKPSASSLDQDDFQRKMDDLNRQIEAQKQAIAGILTKTDLVFLFITQ